MYEQGDQASKKRSRAEISGGGVGFFEESPDNPF